MRPNKPLLLATLKRVQQAAAVGLWDQANWIKNTECGTAFCFAGHALDLCGVPMIRVGGFLWFELEGEGIGIAAARKLGIDRETAGSLFTIDNTLADLERKVCAIVCADDDEDPSEIDTRPDPELVCALCDGTGVVAANGVGGVVMDCPYCPRESRP